MTTPLLSIDEILETAFEIFDEMAEDNLQFSDLENYQQQFNETGAAITLLPASDWEAQVGFSVNPELFIEVQIGFAPNDNIDDVLARMLLSCERSQKFCHILWKR